MNLESASSRADQIARQYLAFGEVPRVSQLVKRIEAVEAENVRDLAQDIFASKKPSLSAVGQLSTLASYNQTLRRVSPQIADTTPWACCQGLLTQKSVYSCSGKKRQFCVQPAWTILSSGAILRHDSRQFLAAMGADVADDDDLLASSFRSRTAHYARLG